jgi:hypothetical protein
MRLWLVLFIVVCLGERSSVRAQDHAGQPGLPPLAEPVPIGQSALPPGALPASPLGPLPANNGAVEFHCPGLNAFEQGPGRPPEQVYFGLGARGLQRQALHSGPVSVLDPGTTATRNINTTVPVTGQDGTLPTDTVKEQNSHTAAIPAVVTGTVTDFDHSGNLPPANAPPFGNFNQVNPSMAWGLQGTLGYRYGDFAIEATGFYMFNHQTTALISSGTLPAANPITGITNIALDQAAVTNAFDPDRDKDATVTAVGSPFTTTQGGPANRDRLDLPFFNEPAGFRGNFLQANQVFLTLQSTVGSAEVNYLFGEPGMGLHGLLGIRYLDIKEQFSELVEDDVNASPDRVSNYQVQTHNRILGAQLGVEGNYPVASWLGVGGFAKTALGANFLDSDVSLTRGDGLIGFQGHRTHQVFGNVWELSFFLDFYLAERARLHAGYNLLWALNVAEAQQQLSYDLSQTLGSQNNHGTVFYHGPVLELQIVF